MQKQKSDHEGRGVLWDVDGTLVDTAELHYQAWVALTHELNQPFTRQDFAATFGQRNPEIIPRLFGTHLTDREVADLGARKEDLYRTAAQKGVELLPGVRPLLDDLRAAGFRQAVASSAPRENLELILRLTGSAPYFAAVVAMEDTQRGKPDPEVFLLAAGKLGIAPAHCLVLEDAPAGVQAAKAGGMKCIAVNFVGHHPETTLCEAGADRVVQTLKQVSAETVRQLLG
jgi:beta-phosphoglucomutase